MPVSNPPALHFGCVTKTPASVLISDWLDAQYEALLHLTNTATYDDAAAVPTAAKWVVSRYQNTGLTEAVYCVPAASSPIAGKVILIWAGAAAGTHASVVMASPDTYTNGFVNFGAYVASAGQTVNAGQYSAWDSATPFSGGTGRFTGYTRVTNTIASQVKLFVSNEYLLGQFASSGSSFCWWGGYGIRAPSTSSTDSEADNAGVVFDFGTSGGWAAASATAWHSVASSQGWLIHGSGSGQAHWYMLVPRASTIRAIGYRANVASGGAVCTGVANNCLSLSGVVEPQVLAVIDRSGGATDGSIVGRHRAIYYGPRRRSGSILSEGGTKTWIAFGANTVSDNDAACLPY